MPKMPQIPTPPYTDGTRDSGPYCAFRGNAPKDQAAANAAGNWKWNGGKQQHTMFLKQNHSDAAEPRPFVPGILVRAQNECQDGERRAHNHHAERGPDPTLNGSKSRENLSYSHNPAQDQSRREHHHSHKARMAQPSPIPHALVRIQEGCKQKCPDSRSDDEVTSHVFTNDSLGCRVALAPGSPPVSLDQPHAIRVLQWSPAKIGPRYINGTRQNAAGENKGLT
jgi:hypothetical protein